MSEIKVKDSLPGYDAVTDISMEEIEKYGLYIIPYFFDPVCAKRQHIDYFYIGIR